MNILAFDCSARACQAAVLAEDRVVARGGAQGGQAETLMPLLVRLVGEAGMTWSDIGLVAVTVGPGSFTGLRIALAAASGLALAGGMATAGVPSFDALAEGVPMDQRIGAQRTGRTLVLAIESGRDEFFLRVGDAEPGIITPEAAAATLSGPLLVAGDGAPRLLPFLPDALLADAPATPDPAAVARLALADLRAGRPGPLRPLYLRAPDVSLPAG